MGGGERKEGGEKIIQSSPNYGDADNTRRLGKSVAPRHFSWDNNWVFLETEGGVTRCQKWCEHPPHADVWLAHASSFFFIIIFYKYQNIFDLHKIYKKIQSAKDANTPKTKALVLKYKDIFCSFTVLKKPKKSLSQNKLKFWVF